VATAGSQTFSIGFTRDGGTVVVRVAGDLDVASAPLLRGALRDVIEAQGNLFLKLDLAGMAFLDSTGLSVLVGAAHRLRESGGDLTLTNVRGSALRVLEVTGSASLFSIVSH
jgi:anti-sigma B factor antagonist